MSNETESHSAAASPSQPGPDLLAERTLAGIFVHVLGLLSGAVLPAVVYAVSDHEFTRRNARNAINWQVCYVLLSLGAVALVVTTVVVEDVLPALVTKAGLLAGMVLFAAAGAFGLLNVLFVAVATWKAIFGDAWEYPVVPDVVGWADSWTVSVGWWHLVAGYVLVAPVLFAAVIWLALTGEPVADGAFWAFFLLLVSVMVASLFVPVAIYRDATTVPDLATEWRPNWVAYLAVPLASGTLTYLLAIHVRRSPNPAGDAVYGYFAGLWIAAAAYLVRRHRQTS